jgi:hypothetical protein
VCHLRRIPADAFAQDALCAYVRSITALACQGMPSIITTDTTVLGVQREDSRIAADTLHRACISVLASLLRSSKQYESILRTHCVQVLVLSTATASGSEFKQKFALLGALTGACDIASVENGTTSVFGDIVPYLLSTVERGLQVSAAAPAEGTFVSC